MDCSQLGDWATRGLIRGKDMLKAELEASSRSMGHKGGMFLDRDSEHGRHHD